MFNLIQRLPIKFSCAHCQRIYLHPLQHKAQPYPHCSRCDQPVQILGLIEAEDISKYPVQFVKALIKST